ncbi:hypothetical protein CN288_22695 [Bacillus sp. AFS023182]|uniref:hypothetical protein n=1 Tax=unclassified Bacillus (in: firmicutes) TaxID=185979 RepID=UPI00047C9709|nr:MULTISPECIES: hypothetical protein [unclassified Bacillus (in: firmicutes)]PFD97227.1 hypothetical protein CN288_22695 [Bacillus sp. AFS023182]
MKLSRNYFPEQAAKEYGSFYIWMRFIILVAWIGGLLVLGYGQFNIMGPIVIIYFFLTGIIGIYFAAFHCIRYLRNYKRQE